MLRTFLPNCFGIYIKNNSFIMAPLYWWNQSLYLKMVDIICTTTFWFGTYVLWICSYDINPFRKMKNSSFLICFINCLDKKPFTKTKTDKKCVIDAFQPNFPSLRKKLRYFSSSSQFSQFWMPVTYSRIFWIYFQHLEYTYFE